MSLPKDGGDVGGPAALTPGGGGSARPREGSRDIQKEGKIVSVPDDWCHSPIKIVPYAIWAWQSDASNLADTVRQTDDRSHAKHSIVQMCFGDEAGIGGGVIFHTHNGACWPKTWSETVRFEGRNAVRHDDEWWMNNKNTWGKLQYNKDLGHYELPKISLIKTKIHDPDREDDEKAAADGTKEAYLDNDMAEEMLKEKNELNPLGPVAEPHTGNAFEDEKIMTFERGMQSRMLGILGQSGPMSPANRPPLSGTSNTTGPAAKSTPKLSPLEGAGGDDGRDNNRTTGEPEKSKCTCDNIVGSYSKLKSKCKTLCGEDSQAHHVWGDKHFRLGSNLGNKFRIQMPEGSASAPTRGQGIAICLDGQKATPGTQHYTAHGSDALIQAMGRNAPTPGTLDFFTVTSLTTQAAIDARPDCRDAITRASDAAAKGLPMDAPLRATNDPLTPGSPASQLLTPRSGEE